MMVEERFGERESALKVSNLILQTNVTPQVRSQALAARARYMASKRNLRELQKIELELKSLPADSIIKEHHGEVLFLIAETQIRPFLQSVNSHRVQDPLQSIFDRYDLFMKTSKDYIAVCDGIVTSFCLASYYRIGRLGERLAELIRDFRIPATYDDKVINQFIVKKEALEDKLNGQIADANKKVNSLLNSGYSLPEWNQLAIWHVRGETNFSSINGELAKAYVQWDMDKKE
jgi:hypothetical protein